MGYTAKRAGYAFQEGSKDLVRSYDPRTWSNKDAAINEGLRYTEGKLKAYDNLVKAGASVGKVGRVALKVAPLVSIASWGLDAYTFGKGFARGWQAYGVNYR